MSPRRGGPDSAAERVYVALRDRLLRGELPAGTRLVELQLAAEYETSRTPVREALRRLEGDGHLVRDPSGGMTPAVPSVRSMADWYEVRLALEDVCVRGAALHGDGELLAAVRADWRAFAANGIDHGPDFVYADESFHDRIAQACGNGVAARMLADVNVRIRILRIHDFTSPDRIAATITEHLEIIDAVCSEDADSAAAFMRAHVQRSANVVRERVGDALARMFEGGGLTGLPSTG